MSTDFVQRLCAAERPFLSGFGQACLDQGLDDEAAFGCLKRAAATFPAVREELVEFQKTAFWGAVGQGLKAVGPKLWGAGKSLFGMGAKAAPTAAPSAAAGAPGLLSRAAGGLKSTVTPGRLQAGSAALGGGLGAMHGYQEGGISGAVTEGGLGALSGFQGARSGGLRGGFGGSLATPLTSATMTQVGMPSLGGAAGGLVQRGQQAFGAGGPTFKQQIQPNVNNFNDLQSQFDQGMHEVNQMRTQWQDNQASGGRYGQAVQAQRDKLYQDFRNQAGAMKADPASIEGTLGNYTPQVNSTEPTQMAQQLADPESRRMFQPHMEKAEADLMAQAQSGKPVDLQSAKTVLMQRAAFTAAEKGVALDELIADAQQTLQSIQQNGITPDTAQKLFQGKGGQELAQHLIQSGEVKGPGDWMQALGNWAASNPVEAGTLLIGGTLALGGMYSAMTGGGIGSWLAMLGGGAMAAAGAGMFGDTGMGKAIGGMFGVQSQGQPLSDVINAPKPNAQPGSIPVVNSQPAGAGTMAQHYAQTATTPEGIAAMKQSLMQIPDQNVQLLANYASPEQLQKFIGDYNKNPLQAIQALRAQIPYMYQGAFDKSVPALTGHMNGAAPTAKPEWSDQGSSGGGGEF